MERLRCRILLLVRATCVGIALCFSAGNANAAEEPPGLEKQVHNTVIAGACRFDELPHGIGMARRCNLVRQTDLQAFGKGLPRTVRCAPGNALLFPNGDFENCRLAAPAQFLDSNRGNAPGVCQAGHYFGATVEEFRPTGYGFCN